MWKIIHVAPARVNKLRILLRLYVVGAKLYNQPIRCSFLDHLKFTGQ